MKVNATKLKQLRDELGWTQEQLAAATGLSLRTIQRCERDGVASLESKKALAAVFAIDHHSLNDSSAAASVENPSNGKEEQGTKARKSGLRQSLWVWIASTVTTVVAALVLILTLPYVNGTLGGDSLAKNIQGQWHGMYGGDPYILIIDARSMRPEGALSGYTPYTLRANKITYQRGGQVRTAEIHFTSPTEMTWTDVTTGEINNFYRGSDLGVRNEELAAALVGIWENQRFKIKITADKIHTLDEGIESPGSAYVVADDLISFNLNGQLTRRRLKLVGADTLQWSTVDGVSSMVLQRTQP